jgi:hypothetical protein
MDPHLDYDDHSVREDLVAAHALLLEHLSSPGSWFSGAERIALASESRQSLGCALCAERRAARSPYALKGEHDRVSDLPEPLVDLVHRVRMDPGSLSRSWFEELRDAVGEGAYVDAVGVVALLAGIDHFCRALGVAPFVLPDPKPGEATGYRPEGLLDQGAWVQMLAPEALGAPEADLFGDDAFVPNIVRALSQTPDHVRALRSVTAAHYVPLGGLMDLDLERDLDRFQIELVAARVSALNECFY